MKKLFLSLMLVAGLATCFTSCDGNQNENESTDHSQTFTLGETSYHVDNAISILNIQYQGSDVYNAIILSEGNLIGDEGAEGEGVIIIFKGDITAGSFTLSDASETYPKYFIGEISVDDVVDFANNINPETYQNSGSAYMASTGTLTIEDADTKYIFTTDGIEVNQYDVDANGNPVIVETKTSSIDFEGKTEDFTLATVEPESMLNESPIVTAGLTSFSYAIFNSDYLVFFSEDGKMFGLISYASWQGNIPQGQITVDSAHPLLYLDLNEIDEIDASVLIDNLTTEGTVNIAKEGDMYVVDIVSGDNNLHYKGTLPQFDFFF